MSTTVTGTNTTNYTFVPEMTYENGQIQQIFSTGYVNHSDLGDLIENENKPNFKPAPAKARDHQPRFKAAPAKANDNSNESELTVVNNHIESSNEEAKKAGSKISNMIGNGNILNNDPSFILSRFRSGDPELFKLLSDPALGPVLMAKIQDAAAAETRMHTLLSNLQKAKDDTLKSIVNNIR